MILLINFSRSSQALSDVLTQESHVTFWDLLKNNDMASKFLILRLFLARCLLSKSID